MLYNNIGTIKMALSVRLLCVLQTIIILFKMFENEKERKIYTYIQSHINKFKRKKKRLLYD